METLFFTTLVLVAFLYSCSNNNATNSDIGAASSVQPGPQNITLEKLLFEGNDTQWILLDPPLKGKEIATLRRYNEQFVGLLVPADTKVITPDFTSVIISNDAVSWREVGIEPNGYYRDVIANKGDLIAVGRGEYTRSGSIAFSSNGRDWKAVFITKSSLKSITSGEHRMVAAGLNGTVVSSTDGVNWNTELADPSIGHLYGTAYGDGVFIIIGDLSVLTSEDGQRWQVVPLHEAAPPDEPGEHASISSSTGAPMPGGLRNILFGNGVFLSWQGKNIYQSSDKGKSWRKVSSSISMRELIYANESFIGIDHSNQIYTSTNGQEWMMHGEATPSQVAVNFNCLDHECFVVGQRILVALQLSSHRAPDQ
jgi:hypothetical protein